MSDIEDPVLRILRLGKGSCVEVFHEVDRGVQRRPARPASSNTLSVRRRRPSGYEGCVNDTSTRVCGHSSMGSTRGSASPRESGDVLPSCARQ